MITRRLLSLFLTACSFTLSAQCINGFEKLVPNPAFDYTSNFGSDFSVHGDFLAVGIPGNDSLGRVTGIVEIFKRQSDDNWKKIATMAPAVPKDALQFGTTVRLSENYLAVGATGYGGVVYIFKKTSAEWTSASETYQLTVPLSVSFGVSSLNPIDISEDELTIAITDHQRQFTTNHPHYIGAFYVYHRSPAGEWNTDTPTETRSPTDDAIDFSRTGVHILDNRIATGCPYGPDGFGNVYIYQDVSGTFNNLTLEAKLFAKPDSNTAFLGYYGFVFTHDGIFSLASVDYNTAGKSGFVYFKTPVDNHWTNQNPTCSFHFAATIPGYEGWPSIQANGEEIVVGFPNTKGDSKVGILAKGSNGWCNASLDIISTATETSSFYSSQYGVRVSASGDNVVVGRAVIPGNATAPIAVEALRKHGSNWSSNFLYPTRKTTNGYVYGRAVVTFDDHLFVAAPYDGNTKPSGGAVYCYAKINDQWEQVSMLSTPNPQRYDDVFGYSMATNGVELAVGAPGYEPNGKVFVYKRTGFNWGANELVQEISLPSSLNASAYGDNIAMDDNWLVIPYMLDGTIRLHLAIFKKENDQWVLAQTLSVGNGSLFSRYSTSAVDIDQETIVIADKVIQRKEDGQWGITCVLSTSDPEPMRISPDFQYWVSNGSSFGLSVDIDGDNIFIGAPTKDDAGTWDVGAVYVYTRRPGYNWSNMKETAKILPRVREESELFGYSLNATKNTLIVGAPGADFTSNGVTPRNKPGRAYLFQALDYNWQEVTPLTDMVGDTFKKDYFGIGVGLDGANFLVGATIEDIPTGKLAGSVYTAPMPPSVKLVPPVCVQLPEVQLTGYPSGGTWSGPGITNATSGTFSPSLVGLGKHVVEYSIPTCSSKAKLMVEVEGTPKIVPASSANILVCKDQPINKVLSVVVTANTNYEWFYSESISDPFQAVDALGSSITATKLGFYMVKASKGGCVSQSPFFKISEEEIDIKTNNVDAICFGTSTDLRATPAGGVWSASNVSGSKLVGNTAGQNFPLYTYRSPNQCFYSKRDTIVVLQAPKPVITRAGGDLCSNGQVSLSIGAVSPDVVAEWYYQPISGGSMSPMGVSGSGAIAKAHGSYQVRAQLGQCKGASEILMLLDQLPLSVTPANEKTNLCFGTTLTFEAKSNVGAAFNWKYSTAPFGGFRDLSTTATLVADKTGYYQVEAENGICRASSKMYYINVLPADSLVAPNVFTPNGDGKNDKFTITYGTSDPTFDVFNRYGVLLYQGRSSKPWDGGDAPPGVYFWIASLNECGGTTSTAKGYVQLVR